MVGRLAIMFYLPCEEGQGLVEYALILVLVAIVIIVILALLGPAIGNLFFNIYSNVYKDISYGKRSALSRRT